MYKSGLLNLLTLHGLGSPPMACLHSGETEDLPVAQSLRLDISAVPAWHWKSRGFLESHWSSIHLGRGWAMMAMNDSSNGSGRKE